MNPSDNLFLIGPMGAGKTSIGRHLATHFKLRFVDLDHEIEAETGADISLIFEMEGEPGFRVRERNLLHEFSAKRGIVLACGGGAVLDADNRRNLADNGFVVYLETSVGQQLERLRRDRARPLLMAPDRRQRLERMAEQRNPLYESIADLRIVTSRDPVTRASARMADLIENAWQRPTMLASGT